MNSERYLYELNQYREALGPRYNFRIIIEQSLWPDLSGLAKEWWTIVEQAIETWEDFTVQFHRRFWNDEVQYGVRENLDFGYHNTESKPKILAYTINLIGIAKELRPALSDSQIINKLSRHFTDEIRSAVIARGMNSLPIFLDLLEKFDQAGPLNYQRQRVDRHPTNTQRPQVNRTPNQENKTASSKFTSHKEESYPNKS